MQMGFLGALITLAPEPIYPPHALTAAAWGITPLQDQQLGGVIMWVPGCLAFLIFGTYALWMVLERSECDIEPASNSEFENQVIAYSRD
jgi:putative membrane protein